MAGGESRGREAGRWIGEGGEDGEVGGWGGGGGDRKEDKEEKEGYVWTVLEVGSFQKPLKKKMKHRIIFKPGFLTIPSVTVMVDWASNTKLLTYQVIKKIDKELT